MEILWIALLFFLASGPLLGVIALLQMLGLQRRMRRLEEALESGDLLAARPEATAARPRPSAEAGVEAPAARPVGVPRAPAPVPAGAAGGRTVSPAPVAAAVSAPRGGRARTGSAPGMRDLEEQLGAHLSVWVAAVALALAGVFLVKYAFDRDLLGPPVRVALGVMLGAGLVAAGEVGRMRRSTNIGASLSAAGIAVLYASFLAATDVYELVPVAVGFGLMALTTATAVGLAVRQGALLAVVGLLGGWATPLLLRTEGPANPVVLFGYLLVLQLGVLTIARRSAWPWLGRVATAGSLLWVLQWLATGFEPAHAAVLYLFLAATGTALGLMGSHEGPDEGRAPAGAGPSVMVTVAGLGPVVLSGLVVAAAGYRPLDWLWMAIVGAGCMALAITDSRFDVVARTSSVVTALLLLAWTSAGAEPARADMVRYATATAGLGALHVLGSYAAMWSSRTPSRWAIWTAVSAVGFFIVGVPWLLDADLRMVAAATALVLAAVTIGLAVPVARRRADLADGHVALAALAVAATTFVSMAVPLALREEWIAVAWSLEVPAVLWIAGQLRVPGLRRLAWPLLALTLVRLLSPAVLTYPIGERPVLNWLLYGYGVPIAATIAAARLAAADGARRLAAVLEAVAVVLGFVLLSREVRQYFVGTDLAMGSVSAAERYAYSAVWAVYGLALLALGVARRNVIVRRASLAVMLLTVAKVFLLDASGLGGLYRVLSFLGLGISLLVLAWLYQRFVLERGEPVGAVPAEASGEPVG